MPGVAELTDDRHPARGPTSIVYWWNTWLSAVGRHRYANSGQVGERVVVARGDRLPAGRVAVELSELDEPDRGPDVGQPEVVAEDLVVVALAHALRAVETDEVSEAVVIRGDEAALAGGHVLGAVEAERTVPEGTGPSAAECRAVGLARVLDDDRPVAVGDRRDHVHVGDEAEQVDGRDRPCAGRDGSLDARGIDQVGVGLDVDEYRAWRP